MSDKKLPKELQVLINDLSSAFYDLDDYKLLFKDNKLQQELMLEVAGNFFSVLHQYYWNRFSIAISRFVEKGVTDRNKNLTIDILEPYINQFLKKEEPEILSIIDEVRENAAPFIKTRNKYLAHRDHDKATKKDIQEHILELQKVEFIFNNIGEIINKICIKMIDTSIGWHAIRHGGADSLLKYLETGVIHVEATEKSKEWWKHKDDKKKSKYAKLVLNEYN